MHRRWAREKQLRRLSLLTPPAMVAAATARRTAGDWRGACAAALVDVHVDLPGVARRYGAEAASRIEADLVGVAPDLMRRFLPRTPSLALAPGQRVVLSRLSGPLPVRRRLSLRRGTAPVLMLTLPATHLAPQRIGLRVVDTTELDGVWYDLPDWTWHADAVAARRWAYGASPQRLAWHHPDGRAYGPDESTPPQRRHDRAAELEEIVALLDAGDVRGAYERAGCAVTLADRHGRRRDELLVRRELLRHADALPVLVSETRRLVARYGRRTLFADYGPVTQVTDDGSVTIRPTSWPDRATGPVAFAVPAPMDAALLRRGTLSPDELHPLVHEALLPGGTPHRRPGASSGLTAPFRVRCGGDWHLLRTDDGRLLTPHHTDAEIERDLVVGGADGPLTGCAAAVRAWRTGAQPVAKRIRVIRRDLFARAFHGDTDGVLAVLAEGLDPRLRDGTGGTLLHWLAHLDHERALPALLAAGLSVRDRDAEGRTPLHRAVADGGAAVAAALVAAGADPAAVDRVGVAYRGPRSGAS